MGLAKDRSVSVTRAGLALDALHATSPQDVVPNRRYCMGTKSVRTTHVFCPATPATNWTDLR